MEIKKIFPQNKYKINSFHNSDDEKEDIYHPIRNLVDKDDHYVNEFCLTLEDQDYNDSKISFYPKKISQKIEQERFQDKQPLRINDLRQHKKRKDSLFIKLIKKKSQCIIPLQRRRQKQFHEFKQNTKELEQI